MKDFLINLGDWFYYHCLSRELKGMDSVLDLGCGSWSPLQKIKKDFFSVGVDIFQPVIGRIKRNKIHDEYKIVDVMQIDKFFKKKSFDAVIALDLTEHLKKKEGLTLLKRMESIGRKKVIVLTPNGFTDQDPAQGNPYQVHQSGWQVEDFARRGYRVYGMRGLKFIRGQWATIKYRPWFFWAVVSVFSQPFVYFLPQLAYQLFAVKKIK